MRDAAVSFRPGDCFSGVRLRRGCVAALGGSTSLLDASRRLSSLRRGEQRSVCLEDWLLRLDLRNFARELMAWLRHLLVVKSGITSPEVVGVADIELARLRELSERFSEEDLVRSFHLLASVEKEIKDSPYPRFALEVGLYKLIHTLRLRLCTR